MVMNIWTKKAYVTAGGALQERVLVKRIVHRRGAENAERIVKGKNDRMLFLARIFSNFASLW